MLAVMERMCPSDVFSQFTYLNTMLKTYHDSNFVIYEQQNAVAAPVQPNLNRFNVGTKTDKTAPAIRPFQQIALGKTRMYRTRHIIPGYCNNEQTCKQAFGALTPPPTPTSEYVHRNPNKMDRQFHQPNVVIRMYEFTQDEWIEFAKKCIQSPKIHKYGYEPLTTYYIYVLQSKTNPLLAKPNQFGARLTLAQSRELLDAYYWVHMKQDAKYQSVLFYYKMFGWYVRAKDSYRITKNVVDRHLFQKQQQLIQMGIASVQLKPTDEDKRKSFRGRKKRKLTM